jgi:hypothetical protein
LRAIAGDPADLQIMYGLDGTRRLPEYTLDWLPGFEGSHPVRVGNAAAGQLQLDVWGEVLDGLHLSREAGIAATDAGWDLQRALLDFLEGNWRQPDNSLWEVRGERRQFVHSKVMAWAGFDRAVTAVQRHGLDGPVDRWRALREQVTPKSAPKGSTPVATPLPAGTMTHTARGRCNLLTMSSSESQPTAPSPASSATAFGSVSNTMQSWLAAITRRTRLAPMRPSPTIASCV